MKAIIQSIKIMPKDRFVNRRFQSEIIINIISIVTLFYCLCR